MYEDKLRTNCATQGTRAYTVRAVKRLQHACDSTRRSNKKMRGLMAQRGRGDRNTLDRDAGI